jgi:hypothetical protein
LRPAPNSIINKAKQTKGVIQAESTCFASASPEFKPSLTKKEKQNKTKHPRKTKIAIFQRQKQNWLGKMCL